jgi:hypothetical protein
MHLSTYEVNAGRLFDEEPGVDIKVVEQYHTMAAARRALRRHSSHPVGWIDIHPVVVTAAGRMPGSGPLRRIGLVEVLGDSEEQHTIRQQANAVTVAQARRLWNENTDPELALAMMRELVVVPWDDEALMRALEGEIPAEAHPEHITLVA